VAADVQLLHADHSRTEQVLLTDVRIKALAPGRLLLAAPQALWDSSREMYYVQRSVLVGESLTARVEASADKNLRWSLLGPDEKERANGVGAEAKHAFLASDTAGIWTLRFESDRGSATVLVLLQDARTGPLFDRAPVIPVALLASIRERQQALRKLTHVDAGMNIAKMDPDWLLAGLPSYFAIVLQPAELAMLDAMIFRATGDREALTEAKMLLRGMSDWPLWVHPWFPAHGYHSYYPVGIMTKFVVASEEFLGDDLQATDRRALDAALMEQSVKPIYEEYVLEDRLQFSQSNWIGNTVGGALFAALANNDRSAAGYALGLFVKDRDHIRAAYTPDGSYGEGVTYHRFDMEMTALVAELAKRKLGSSIDGSLANGERYMRYAAYGDGPVLDYGDSHVDIRPSNVFAYLTAQNNSPLLTDFYFRYRDTGTAQLLSRVLWENEIKPVSGPVTLGVPSALFAERGIAVLRDGWDANSTIAAMRAGVNFNHNHADEGSLFYATKGMLWLGEAGYADYYKDPSYRTFNIQAVGHNVLLLDGNPESQILPGNAVMGVAPKFTHALVGEGASLLQADLSAAYGDSVSRYTRSLYWAPNGLLVVVDHVTTDKPHTFQQLWHPKVSVSSMDGAANRWQMTDRGMHVAVQSFGSQALSVAQRFDPMPLEAYERSESGLIDRPTRLEVSTRVATTNATIATVIEPVTGVSGNETKLVWSDEGLFLVLKMGETTLRIRKADGAGDPAMTVTSANDVMVLGGNRLEGLKGGASVTANHGVDMAVHYQVSGDINLEIHADVPSRITLQGLETMEKSSSWQAQATSFEVAAGRTLVKLRARKTS
jgi:hypothetical protein